MTTRGVSTALGALALGACLGACDDPRAPRGVSPSVAATSASAAPTSAEISPALRAELDAALAAKGPGYAPRTRHKNPDGTPKYTNRLIRETSPYLLQHAHNPVSWFPWGDEAFALARALGRPIFLSVGYSTCHWCHVMEEESFEDEEIAAQLNAGYIPIKVDREERPDVDSLYMKAVQMLTGRGGWPMSVWLTPEREPFFGGTYFPPRDGARGTRFGFLTVLREQLTRFRAAPSRVAEEAGKLARRVRSATRTAPGPGGIDRGVIARAVSLAKTRFDPQWGGRRGAPKFPSSFPTRLMLRRGREDPESLQMAATTLEHMARGGIFDHVGGGFHRYSVDAQWLVPHFEKMLYDNAQLATAYVEAYQATGRVDFRRVAERTLDYLLREMRTPDGVFMSATDADSQGPSGEREEGYYFTWTPAELVSSLDPDEVRAVTESFGVTPGGNFEGRTILHVTHGPDDVARSLALEPEVLERRLEDALSKLLARRRERPPPLTDTKVQTSWNGLVISALAKAGFVFDEPRYVEAATRASKVLMQRCRVDGELRHSLTGDAVSDEGFLEDHAFLAAGLVDLFMATSDLRFLSWAEDLMDALEARFADAAGGGYFLTPKGAERLLGREKPDEDMAIPSGNSVALATQLRLAELTLDDRYRARAETTARAFSDALSSRPLSLGEMLVALDFHFGDPKQVVIVVPDADPGGTERPLLDVVRRTFAPRVVFVRGTETAPGSGPLSKRLPWLLEKTARRGKATAYVCRRGACELPTSDPKVLARQLVER